MQEHPIPQDITGYQFHIIGNMTIKQFAEIGGGAFLGFLIYTTNLPLIVKWPLIVLVVAMGAMAAFVPIEERPFDHWVVTFIKVLYKPTKFYWKKIPKIPDPFLYKPQQIQPSLPEIDLAPARRERVKEYLSSLHVADPLDPFDEYQKNRVDDIVSSFAVIQAQTLDIEKQVTRPNLEVRVRDLTEYLPAEVATEEVYDQPYQAPAAELQPTAPEPTMVEPLLTAPLTAAPQAAVLDQPKPQLAVDQVAQDIAIPETENIQVAPPTSQEEAAELAAIQRANGTQVYSEAQTTQQPIASQQAQYNTDLPFPTPQDEPNTPVGMVLGPQNELITNAIVEFITETGNIVRAVKTNSLGQFTITTKLNDGVYTLQVEKDGYLFTPQQIQLAGEVIQPIEVRGTPVA
jgi:hypothetical protein